MRRLAQKLPSEWLAQCCALAAGGIAIYYLVLWSGPMEWHAYAAYRMKVNTAIGILGTALALVFLGARGGRDVEFRRISFCLSFIPLLIGLLSLLQSWSHIRLGIDELFVADVPTEEDVIAPGRPAPNTALTLLLLGGAQLSAALPLRSRREWLPHVLVLPAAVISLMACIGYLNSVSFLYKMKHALRMSPYTAFSLLLLAFGMLVARRHWRPIRDIASGEAGGMMARRVLPVVILLPVVLGWLRLQTEVSGLLNPAAGVSVFSCLLVVIFAFFIWWNARLLNAAAEAKSELQIDLARSNEELTRFASVASHDLQQPLRTIANYLTLLDRTAGDKLDDTSQRWLRYAVDGAKRMARLVDELLKYSRVGNRDAPPENVDLELVMLAVVHGLDSAIREKKAVVKWMPLPQVSGNVSHFEQLFQNLVSNALKYCDRTPEIHIDWVKTFEGEVRLFVRDNGIGF